MAHLILLSLAVIAWLGLLAIGLPTLLFWAFPRAVSWLNPEKQSRLAATLAVLIHAAFMILVYLSFGHQLRGVGVEICDTIFYPQMKVVLIALYGGFLSREPEVVKLYAGAMASLPFSYFYAWVVTRLWSFVFGHGAAQRSQDSTPTAG